MISKSKRIFQVFLVSTVLSILVFYLNLDSRFSVKDQLLYGSESVATRTIPRRVAKVKAVPRGHYIRVGDLDVALVTAVHYKNFPAKEGYNVFLNGWARYHSPIAFKCCFLSHQNSTYIVFMETMASLYHIYNQWRVDMQNAEFSCTISKDQLKSFPVNQTLEFVSFAEKSCSDATNEVLGIEYRKTIPKSVGICLKITYGYLDPELVVEWFEYQRIMGVTKIFSFLSEDLDPRIKKVFEYYDSIGLSESNTIHPAPRKDGKHRNFEKPRWDQQAWVDEVMAINDCKHRMAGLDFVIVHDMDEYIVPRSPQDNIYTILKKTLTKYPRAGAFSFDSHVSALDWGPSRDSPLHLMKYTNLTKFVNFDGAGKNTRWGFISDRIYFAQNNKAWPRKNYKSVRVDNKLYTLVHRRMCKSTWKTCNNTAMRRMDDTFARYEDQLLQHVQRVPLSNILDKNSTRYIKEIMSWKRRD